jgi:hypothetical protein
VNINVGPRRLARYRTKQPTWPSSICFLPPSANVLIRHHTCLVRDGCLLVYICLALTVILRDYFDGLPSPANYRRHKNCNCNDNFASSPPPVVNDVTNSNVSDNIPVRSVTTMILLPVERYLLRHKKHPSIETSSQREQGEFPTETRVQLALDA